MKNKITYITLLWIICPFIVIGQQYNQVGYTPHSEKQIFLPRKYENHYFKVITPQGVVVHDGIITKAKYWAPSNSEVSIADFSSLEKSGTYKVLIPLNDIEIKIKINENIYNELAIDVSKFFYHARASMKITKKYGGKYFRKAGHKDQTVYIHSSAASSTRPEGTVISSPGGWYDAGDYNKYIVNSSISTYTLLHAVECYHSILNTSTFNIPESRNNIPDLLDEALYNLKWMITMQDPNDGGVYHKLTTKKFSGMISPIEDNQDRYVVSKSTAATLDFAATMAKAVRVLKPYKSHYSSLIDKCKEAAKKAWKWAKDNPSILYIQPNDITTGEYKDSDLSDEWLWASTELYLTFNDFTYFDEVRFKKTVFNIPQWRKVATLSLYSILSSDVKNDDLRSSAHKELIKLVESYYNNYINSAYKISNIKFDWGSNGQISNQGMLFLQAYRLTHEERYLKSASNCLSYLLGANPTGYCFVTGYGIKSPKHIHDRRTISTPSILPLPGSLVGGATTAKREDCGIECYPSSAPASCYLDKSCSFSTNEIAINWNAPLVYLVWGIITEYNK